MTSPLPLEIIGGGLAGLSLGLALRREGVPVILSEAGDYPRHRVCGEFISGLSASTIVRLGLEPFLTDARRHREVAWFVDGRAPRVQRLPAEALGISRRVLDSRLAGAFADAGGDLRVQTRVIDFAPRAGRVFATGRRRGRSPWLGLKIHAANLPLKRGLEIHLGEQAYVGLARVEGDRVNICGLFRRRKVSAKGASLLGAYLRAAGFDSVAARLDEAAVDSASFCAVAALEFDRRVPTPDRIMLGDTCAMIPPFTGNGMAMAFQSAELALDPLLAYAQGKASWSQACHDIHQALARRFRLRLASADLLHPWLLQPVRQRWLATLGRAHLLPFQSIYTILH